MKYIWIGASSAAERMIRQCEISNKNLLPVVILDNDVNKKGTNFYGFNVDLVINIKDYLDENTEIIISSSYTNEIKEQITKLGITHKITDFRTFMHNIDREIILKNKNLKLNKKKRRCFIVGNGPSLKLLDLNKLANEDTIMVNNIFLNEQLMSLNPNYWMLADKRYWLQSEDFLHPIQNTVETRLKETLVCINREATSYVPHLRNHNNFYYYSLDVQDIEQSNINFEDILPAFSHNVASVSLMLAIYLEYEEIILIGCDHSWWSYSKNDIDNGVIHNHFYEQSEAEKESIRKLFKSMGYEGIQASIVRQKYEYQTMKEIAAKSNIKILNATPHTYVEIFDKVDYESLF